MPTLPINLHNSCPRAPYLSRKRPLACLWPLTIAPFPVATCACLGTFWSSPVIICTRMPCLPCCLNVLEVVCACGCSTGVRKMRKRDGKQQQKAAPRARKQEEGGRSSKRCAGYALVIPPPTTTTRTHSNRHRQQARANTQLGRWTERATPWRIWYVQRQTLSLDCHVTAQEQSSATPLPCLHLLPPSLPACCQPPRSPSKGLRHMEWLS